jgi:hypothetical protein
MHVGFKMIYLANGIVQVDVVSAVFVSAVQGKWLCARDCTAASYGSESFTIEWGQGSANLNHISVTQYMSYRLPTTTTLAGCCCSKFANEDCRSPAAAAVEKLLPFNDSTFVRSACCLQALCHDTLIEVMKAAFESQQCGCGTQCTCGRHGYNSAGICCTSCKRLRFNCGYCGHRKVQA